jgi:hypothetical protein
VSLWLVPTAPKSKQPGGHDISTNRFWMESAIWKLV